MTEKFAPEKQIPLKELKPIIKEAERREKEEAERAGSLAPDQVSGPELFAPEPAVAVKPKQDKPKKYIPKNVFIEKSFKDN